MSMTKADIAYDALTELLDDGLKSDIKHAELDKIMNAINTLYDIAEGNGCALKVDEKQVLRGE